VLGFTKFCDSTPRVKDRVIRIKDWIHTWRICISALLCAAVCFFIFPFLQTYLFFILIAFALGLGLGAAQPTIMTLVHSTAPRGRVAEALGLRLTIIHGSQVILPLIFGAFGTALGTSAIFWVVSVLAASGVVLAVKKQKHIRAKTP